MEEVSQVNISEQTENFVQQDLQAFGHKTDIDPGKNMEQFDIETKEENLLDLSSPTVTTETQESPDDIVKPAHNVVEKVTSEDFVSSKSNVEQEIETLPKHDGSLSEDLRLKSPLAQWILKRKISLTAVKLIYWCDIQRSSVSLTVVLLFLFALKCYPFIQVVASFALSLLVVAFLYRIGMTVVNAVQKTSAEHPFKHLLDERIEIPESSVNEFGKWVCCLLNKNIEKLQRLFLVEDAIDSIKFGLFLWLVSYIGSCFNFLSLAILVVVGLFVIPKLYEEKQDEIDRFCQLSMGKSLELASKVEQKIPENLRNLFKEKRE